MSLLREIMQTFGRQRRRDPATNPAYTAQLACCSDDELLYEWTWLERRLEESSLASGPEALLQRQEASLWRGDLVRAMDHRALSPVPQRGPIDPAHHAWDVRDEAIRLAWRLGRSQAPD
ncbi:hypothetical protein KQ313_11595 [Synechococcus sp. CS-1325]|uniref:hypothetical protein n=1 Tax=Synechococcus sp. CS-1325 TaxID=2847979 RepID=UPI000DB0FF22|nr:hypothetical protein [Synechococcus sp. CS-1325]MCT0200322.1 hypothetical protein [Synechococcus sp. CS-1325]PZU98985.1 MAG: hypothetical protein DCF24_10090 [Cyanobium sp.]